MLKKYTYKNLTWIDAENPSKSEVGSLMEEYDLDPAVAQEISLPTYKPKIVRNDKYIYLVLHFPAYRHTHCGDMPQEIDFVIGSDFLITTSYCHVDQIENIAKIFEVQSMIERDYFQDNPGALFHYIMKELYKGLSDEIDYINDSLQTIEKKIFQGQEKQMVIALSGVNRNLLNFRNSIDSQTEVIEDLEDIGREFFSLSYVYNLNDIASEHFKVQKALEKNISLLSELRETNNSLLSTKQNEIMKTLTIITVIVMPFSIVASMFQMGMTYAPIVGMDYDFYWVVAFEILIAILIFIIARRKKWL
ncbi:MAG: CorA family divalent cation transporter [bacterium]